jgi:oligopeptidase A
MTSLLEDLPAPLPFDQLRPEQVEPGVTSLLAQARAALDAIAASSDDSYEATFGALEAATLRLEVAMGVVEHLEAVRTTPELRAAYSAVLPEVSDFWSSLALHEGLYRRLARFAASAAGQVLRGPRRRFADKTLEEFRRQGAELDAPGKERLRAIDRELSQLTTRYSQNVLDATNAFALVVGEERVAGLPESARIAAREAAAAAGASGYRFGLQSPAVVAVLNYADDAALRRDLWRAFNRRAAVAPDGGEDNVSLARRVLALRRERARLLGYADFADLVTADRMAKSGAAALAFVEELREKTEPAFRREQEELLAFRRRLEGPEAPELEPWDVAYYSEKQRQALFDFDEEQLRPYFSAPRVLAGAFSLAERLFGVRAERAELPVWHPSVEAYRLLDEAGALRGLFYVDLYPRADKRDGAWMHGLVAATPPAPHVALFCCNAQPPTQSTPSLMSFREVETVFHEFGHLLHHCLSEVPVRGLSCTRVAQDFVELPSQILENWCSEKEALDGFALHYETDAPLPAELVRRLLSARNYRAATMQMRQLGFAAVDLALHTTYDPEAGPPLLDYANGILQRYSAARLPADYALLASFGHLFSHPVGYAAGYYSYKWAEVLDADAYSRFRRAGIFDRTTGEAFRRAVLARGDSADPGELFEEFMGRPPRLEAMLERLGLSASG